MQEVVGELLVVQKDMESASMTDRKCGGDGSGGPLNFRQAFLVSILILAWGWDGEVEGENSFVKQI